MSAEKKCDAPRCGWPAAITTRMGARYCSGHAYLAEPKTKEEK